MKIRLKNEVLRNKASFFIPSMLFLMLGSFCLLYSGISKERPEYWAALGVIGFILCLSFFFEYAIFRVEETNANRFRVLGALLQKLQSESEIETIDWGIKCPK